MAAESSARRHVQCGKDFDKNRSSQSKPGRHRDSGSASLAAKVAVHGQPVGSSWWRCGILVGGALGFFAPACQGERSQSTPLIQTTSDIYEPHSTIIPPRSRTKGQPISRGADAAAAGLAPIAKPGGESGAAPEVAPSPNEPTFVPKRIRKVLDSTAAQEHPALQEALPRDAVSALRSTRVPVLLPADYYFHTNMFPVGHPDWYSTTSTYAGMTVVVQGDRVATLDPEAAPAGWRAPTWRAPLVTHNEGIVEATFLAWGASYVVSIECADPASDPRCTGDGAVLNMVQMLRRWPGQAREMP